jgi:hypothetical protein
MESLWTYEGVKAMVDIRLQIPDELVEQLQKKLGTSVKATDMARDAMTLFNWAVNERAKGRLVLSSNDDISKPVQLVMPSIEKAAPPKAE